MDNQTEKPSFYDRAWNWLKWPLVVLVLSLLGLIVYWAFQPFLAWEGTGFVYYDADVKGLQPRRLWDWLGLLIVPTVLALGAVWFNKSQKETELKIAKKARDVDREIAAARQNQVTLEAYFDRMTDLLLEHNLRKSEPDSEVRSIAKATTITVVRSLDNERNRQLFAFLAASRLLSTTLSPPDSVIDLKGVDFSNTHLMGVNLNHVSLSSTIFSQANLFAANLDQADLTRALLMNVNLRRARLRATTLTEAYMMDADLRDSDLIDATLIAAKLNRANLTSASLRGARLLASDFTKAILDRADLSHADLTRTELHQATLSKAILFGATGWTFAQLSQAKALAGAVMPDAAKIPDSENMRRSYDKWVAHYIAEYGRDAEGRPPQ